MILLASTNPDPLWNTFFGALFGAVFGGLIATGIVAYLTEKWIEKRERRNRRDELRLELYLEVVDLILVNEQAIAEAGGSGQMPSVEIQLKRLRISHRLKLLGSEPVRTAFDAYRKLVFRETAHSVEYRSKDADAVERARDTLIAAMMADI